MPLFVQAAFVAAIRLAMQSPECFCEEMYNLSSCYCVTDEDKGLESSILEKQIFPSIDTVVLAGFMPKYEPKYMSSRVSKHMTDLMSHHIFNRVCTYV